MQFSEIPKRALEATGKFTKEQLAKREARLANPALQRQLEQMKDSLKGDIKNACAHGFDAVCSVFLKAPLSSMWEGSKEFGNVLAYNLTTKSSKKKSYSHVPAAMVTELFSEWRKGAISTAKMAGNLSLAAGRAVALGGRYTIGK